MADSRPFPKRGNSLPCGTRRSVEDAEFYGVGDALEVFDDFASVGRADVGDGVADSVGGFQVLSENVGGVRGEDVVDLREHAGNVFVNVNEAMRAFDFWQLHAGEINAVERAAVADIFDNALGDE